MGESIKVSVLMLTFNQEQYVDEAIRGVVHQDAPFDFELVIGDDCSSDGTVTACRRCIPIKSRYMKMPLMKDC